ncbi:MAG: hypothetical protein ACLRXQ_03190 [Phascolarctobacterium faecium]
MGAWVSLLAIAGAGRAEQRSKQAAMLREADKLRTALAICSRTANAFSGYHGFGIP